MVLSMTRPWKHPKSKMCWLRKWELDRLRAVAGKLHHAKVAEYECNPGLPEVWKDRLEENRFPNWQPFSWAQLPAERRKIVYASRAKSFFAFKGNFLDAHSFDAFLKDYSETARLAHSHLLRNAEGDYRPNSETAADYYARSQSHFHGHTHPELGRTSSCKFGQSFTVENQPPSRRGAPRGHGDWNA